MQIKTYSYLYSCIKLIKSKQLLYINLAMVLLVVLPSCFKHEVAEDEIPTATITFSSPAADAVFRKSDTVTVQATVTSTAPLHGYELAIRNVNNGATLYFNHVHNHFDSILVNEKWKSTLTTAAALEAEITVYVDHELHKQTKKVNFSVQ